MLNFIVPIDYWSARFYQGTRLLANYGPKPEALSISAIRDFLSLSPDESGSDLFRLRRSSFEWCEAYLSRPIMPRLMFIIGNYQDRSFCDNNGELIGNHWSDIFYAGSLSRCLSGDTYGRFTRFCSDNSLFSTLSSSASLQDICVQPSSPIGWGYGQSKFGVGYDADALTTERVDEPRNLLSRVTSELEVLFGDYVSAFKVDTDGILPSPSPVFSDFWDHRLLRHHSRESSKLTLSFNSGDFGISSTDALSSGAISSLGVGSVDFSSPNLFLIVGCWGLASRFCSIQDSLELALLQRLAIWHDDPFHSTDKAADLRLNQVRELLDIHL